MSEIKNESFSIGDRFRGLVNGEILVVEALPKKGDEIRSPGGGRWFEKSDSVVFVSETDGRRSKVGLEMAKRLPAGKDRVRDMRFVKPRKPRGTKLNGEKSFNFCTGCYSPFCDPFLRPPNVDRRLRAACARPAESPRTTAVASPPWMQNGQSWSPITTGRGGGADALVDPIHSFLFLPA